jgi:CRP-like cAMP-binding protein
MDNSHLKDLIKKFPFFQGIDDERIDQLCDETDIVDLEADSILLRKGEPCHKGLYLIAEGEILVENPDRDVRYTVRAGDVVGITAFLGRRTYAVTATSLVDSELIFLPDI